MSTQAASDRATPSLALILGVLGVVYGDIGTSPLYAMRAAVSHFEDGGVEPWEVLGLLKAPRRHLRNEIGRAHV